MSRDGLFHPPRFGVGPARGGGSFHMSFRSGSRGKGACARSAYEYIAREHEYAREELDRAVHVESGHMPDWTHDEARAYWDAADCYERANGRLFVGGDFALPRDLEPEEQIALAREVVHDLTDAEHLPYTFAIHAGEDREGAEHNPHVHVMISERMNDGIERPKEQWFHRANREHPERGGAAKSRSFHGREWVEEARARLAERINARLREHGREERVDHRSYARQGVAREPGEHFGPEAAHMVSRTPEHDRLEQAVASQDIPERLAHLDDQIQALEQTRAQLLHESEAIDPERRGQDRSPARTPEQDIGRGR